MIFIIIYIIFLIAYFRILAKIEKIEKDINLLYINETNRQLRESKLRMEEEK
jgi:hypothetical protein